MRIKVKGPSPQTLVADMITCARSSQIDLIWIQKVMVREKVRIKVMQNILKPRAIHWHTSQC